MGRTDEGAKRPLRGIKMPRSVQSPDVYKH